MREKLAKIIVDANLRGKTAGETADAVIQALPVMVKPLVWQNPYERTSGELIAETVLNNVYYSITKERGKFWLKVRSSTIITGIVTLETLEAAQAAANAHHQAAIMRAMGVTE